MKLISYITLGFIINFKLVMLAAYTFAPLVPSVATLQSSIITDLAVYSLFGLLFFKDKKTP